MGFDNWEAAARSPLAGALWETHVVVQVVKHFTAKGRSVPLWFWRTVSGIEVDLLIERGGRFTAIEEENIFRRDLALMENTPVMECYRQNGVLTSNIDSLFVMSEWFGPSVIKMPEPLHPAGKAHQTAAGAVTKTSTWLQPER